MKFYQHFDESNEKQLGLVTTLKYIDDISDDEFVFYVFNDGTKINKEFIGTVDEGDPKFNRRLMVELAGATYKWTINKIKIEPEEIKEAVQDVDGNMYYVASPYENRNDASETMNAIKAGFRYDYNPPHKPAKLNIEPDEDYMLSLHPELADSDDVSVVKTNVTNTVSANVFATKTSKQNTANTTYQQPVTEKRIQPGESGAYIDLKFQNAKNDRTNIVFNVDNINTNICKTIKVVADGQEFSFSVDEFKSYMSKRNVAAEKVETVATIQEVRASEEVIKNENILVKNMIDLSKKKTCSIMMKITLELPPKEVYDTIKNSYDESLTDSFVESLTARIPQESLLKSLAYGLRGFYDKQKLETAQNTTADNNLQIPAFDETKQLND